jgi:transposase
MPQSQPAYPAEYRRRIIELARAGRSVNELAREFEPSANAIRYWLKQAGLDEGLRSDGLTTDERVELRLRRGTGGCVKKVRAWQKRRPGSRRRPAQCRHGVPIRECESGDLRGCQHVPGPGCLRQRLLCVAPAATLSTGTGGCRTLHAHPRDPSILARNLWRAADSPGITRG